MTDPFERQRQIIFRLLFQRFGAMIGETDEWTSSRPATLWRVAVVSWLCCQGLIVIQCASIGLSVLNSYK